jgi:uncharacterized protein
MESWKIGQRVKNNGVGLFVFIADHSTRIEVNYGLEGALPDAICKRIIEDEILPRFRTANYAGGLTAGISAIQQAIRGEYQGSGRTAADAKTTWWTYLVYLVLFIFLIGIGFLRHRSAGGGTVFDRSGRHVYTAGLLLGLLGGAFGGGGSGGGGFSGGGGSGGGGGASGRW